MPAHIFSRLGMWSEALASCKSAWDASVAWVKHDKLGVDKQDFHSLNWTMNLEMLQGHRKAADAALATFAASVRTGMDHGMRNFYVNWVSEYLGYTEEWSRLDELLAPLSGPVVDTDHAAGAQCHPGAPDPDAPPKELFEASGVASLRMLVAVRLHDVKLATKLLAEQDKIQSKIEPWVIKQMGKAEWDKHEPERKRMHDSVLVAARGDDKKLLELARLNAAEVDKQPAGEEDIFGGGIHAGIAEVLMRLKRPKDALAELEPVVKRHPRNSYLLRDAARAADAAGDHATARKYYQQLLEVWATAEPGTPGLDEAKRAVSVAAK
jgi:tetratricopeptide (TPR) repeat protein